MIRKELVEFYIKEAVNNYKKEPKPNRNKEVIIPEELLRVFK